MLLVLFVHDDRSAEEQREGGLLGAVSLQHDPRLAAPGLSRVDQALCPPAEGPAVGSDLDRRALCRHSLPLHSSFRWLFLSSSLPLFLSSSLPLFLSSSLPLFLSSSRSLARRYLPPDIWWGEQAVLRLSMGNFLLFVTLAVVMSFPAPVLTRDDWRDAKLHHGGYRSRPTCARSSHAPTLSLALRASFVRQEATS